MFETMVHVDQILENEFYYDMQLEFLAKLLFFSLFSITIFTAIFTIISYSVFEHMLGLGNPKFYSSFFMANLPFVTTITGYLVFTVNIRIRFIYINTIFEQMTHENVENIIVKDETRTGIIWEDTRSLLTKLIDFFKAKSLVSRRKVTKSSASKDIRESISRLIHLHTKLCDCVDQSNKVFSVKILISVAYMFVFIVFACFTGYRWVVFFMCNVSKLIIESI